MQATANKKTQALRAKLKSDLQIAWFRINMNRVFALKFIKNLYIFCRRLIVFHLPSSQRQMKRKVLSALSATLR
jgi:hypothetical protein